MYFLFITLVFSLALGPDVELLNAAELTSVPSNHSTVSLPLTQSSPGEINLTEDEETTIKFEDTTGRALTTTAENVEQTSEKSSMMSELLTTAEPTAISVTIIITSEVTSEVSTQSRQEEKDTSMTSITTTMPPQTPSPSPVVSDPPTLNTTPSVLTPTPEKEETTDTSPTTMPTPTTTPTTVITTTFTTQKQTTPMAPDTETSSPAEEMTSTTNSSTGVIGAEGSADVTNSKKEANWLIIAIIALVVFCILMTLCVGAVVIKRRNRKGKQNFAHTNGQRSKKKKGAEDDVWAGPVKLGAKDCEGSEDSDVEGEEKTTDKTDVTGLSTFVTLEQNGGVGRPGSPEVEKWEEQEPLLYIDEQEKEKRNEAGKSEDADAKDGTGETDVKEAEPNGGEAFCLTTAV